MNKILVLLSSITNHYAIVLLIWLVSLVSSCQSTEKAKITIPASPHEFYKNAFSELEEQLQHNPTKTDLLRKKTYYCKQLNWPNSCIGTLDELKKKNGMTMQLAQDYIDYYTTHNEYVKAVHFIENWKHLINITDSNRKIYIAGLVKINAFDSAKTQIQKLLNSSYNTESLAFISKQYENMQDTTLAIKYLSDLYDLDNSHPSTFDFARLLFAFSLPDSAFKVMEKYRDLHVLNNEQVEIMSTIYLENGYLKAAIEMIKPYSDNDYAAYMLASTYKVMRQYDSAVFYLDAIFRRDTTKVNRLYEKGRLFEDRGWWSTAKRIYKEVLDRDTTFIQASQRIRIIDQKRAYMEHQQRKETLAPIFDIKPRKKSFQ